MSIKDQIDLKKLPRHIAIIMDGNGRWAKDRNKPRIFGHRSGVKAVKQTAEAAAEIGIEYLTLYAFSTENWSRPKLEVDALMALLVETTNKEIKTLMENNIRLEAIGDIDALPKHTKNALFKGMETTKDNTRMTLVLALNYSGKHELLNAIKNIGEKVKAGEIDPEEIDVALIDRMLYTADIPDPELLIRTSGEHRISNFLLWQSAYTEFYFTNIYWPEFSQEELHKAILDYQQRERRFGKTSDQLVK